jgi:hypothetical protein
MMPLCLIIVAARASLKEAIDDGLVTGQLRQQQLHRGAAAHELVLGDVHGPHPALAKLRNDLVATDRLAYHNAKW